MIERADKGEDSFRHELWLADAEGRNARRLCPKQTDCTDPKFSPDGKRLAYLSDADEVGQIWVARVAGGGKHAITSGKEGVSDFDWLPTEPSSSSSRRPDARKGDEAPWVITGSQILRDGEGFDDGRHTHLWVVDASGGTPKALTSGSYDDATPRWSPKGDWIAFVSNRNPDPDVTDDTDIWLVSASGGPPRRLAANPGPDTDPVWSHAGDRIAFVGALRANDYYLTTHLMVAPVEGGAACDLTAALDNWVSLDDVVGGGSRGGIAWSADDASLNASSIAGAPTGSACPRRGRTTEGGFWAERGAGSSGSPTRRSGCTTRSPTHDPVRARTADADGAGRKIGARTTRRLRQLVQPEKVR